MSKSKRKAYTKHGESKTHLYKVWKRTVQHCYNPNAKGYKYFGGSGITMCKEWRTWYLDFKAWAMATGYEEGMMLARIDINGPYNPNNCYWATQDTAHVKMATNVFATVCGETKTLVEWSNKNGGRNSLALLSYRIKSNKSDEFAVLAPAGAKRGCDLYDDDGFMVLDPLHGSIDTIVATAKQKAKRKK